MAGEIPAGGDGRSHIGTEHELDYHQLQDQLACELPEDVGLFNELHALLVHVGHHYCRKQKPHCESCPLQEMLPGGQIVEPDY